MPSDQKHVLEIKRVPVKHMHRGAMFCETCKRRRGRINYLRKGDKYNQIENGLEELRTLEEEEKMKQQTSSVGWDFWSENWPY